MDSISAEDRARRIRLLAMDVDGVLTDGAVIYGAGRDLDLELKAFHVRDGLGISLARSADIKIAWLTGRRSDAVARRAKELRVDAVIQGAQDKGAALRELAKEHGLELDDIAFIGDDLNDLPALRIAGLTLAPADAVLAVRDIAHHVTEARGGRGAVREVIELLLRAQGKLGQVREAFLRDLKADDRRRHSR